MTSNPFSILIERFFTDHLRTQRNVSPLTIEAYSDTFRMLLRFTPHTWRHSTAMHLLQAGVPLEVIALWLGHEQPAVTHTYVQADIKMKRECMELLEQPSAPRRKRDPMRFSRLLSFLEAQ